MKEDTGQPERALSKQEVERFVSEMSKQPYVRMISAIKGRTPATVRIEMAEGPQYWRQWVTWDIEFPESAPRIVGFKRLAEGLHIYYRAPRMYDGVLISSFHISAIYAVASLAIALMVLLAGRALGGSGTGYGFLVLLPMLLALLVGAALGIAGLGHSISFKARLRKDIAEAAKAATSRRNQG